MTAPDIVAIVLAGGASSRFGSDKLAASLDGRPLLHHALEAVAAVAGRIVVVIGPEAPVPTVSRELAARVVLARDAAALGGPLAGLAAGLATIGAEGGEDAPAIALVVGGDMPSLVPAVLRLLAETLATNPSLAAMTLGASDPAPLPMAVRLPATRAAIDGILADGRRRSLLALLEAIPSASVAPGTWRPLDPAGVTLLDVDTPGDLEHR